MRKITEKAALAFWNSGWYTNGNTHVISCPLGGVEFRLHGHRIATWHQTINKLELSMRGFGTLVTRERLNGILDIGSERFPVLRGYGYSQRNYTQYFNAVPISSHNTIIIDLLTGKAKLN